jgi:glycine dehydrogenase subunit 1
MARKGFVPGVPVGRWYKGLENVLLVACTEKTEPEHIRLLAETMGGAL